ncbi:AAA family ATPase [Brevibacillus sp. DP1.3A]|uniref:AAA family ATPase n=1 Tax=Brevibacillus sp. DP1.3A TaxID=2738867 RepID=UPI00156B6207|nr:AAA family ATPase [Brevibacillus sp. DP1.3A]UED76078.1 ATP-binding protein [Brevibacillus sp. DP1.3A]
MFTPTLAVREKLKGCLAVIGASGSGKTLSSLFIAYGMMRGAYPELDEASVWKKIGVVDTEHKRALLYVGTSVQDVQIGQFFHIDLQSPYSTERYEAAIEALKKAGCEVVIVDSLSHAWEGIGGILDKQIDLGGRFQDWKPLKPVIKKFVQTLTENDLHIIGTMRTKQDYQAVPDDTGRLQIRKLGLKPIQKDDLEYEFMIVFQIDQDHKAVTTKDNSNMFVELVGALTPEHGTNIYKWLELGIDVKAEEEKQRTEAIEKVNTILKNKPDAMKQIEQMEFKAGRKLDQFTLAMAQRALEILGG